MGKEIDLFNQILELLPEGWEAKAKELGALERTREIKSPEDLLRMLLLYFTEGKSYAVTSALVSLSGKAAISKVAVFKRVQKSADWLKWICEEIYRRAGLLTEKPLWLEGKNVLLVDGSSEDVKNGDKHYYYMLHYSLDLFTLSVREFSLSDTNTGEKLSNFKKFSREDIVMGDRCYSTLTGIGCLKEQGVGYVLRMNAGRFCLYDEEKQRIDLLERLSGLEALETADISSYCIINGRHEPIRICAMRKDEQSEEAGMKRLVKTNQRKHGNKKEVSELQEDCNKYIIVVTSFGQEVSAGEVLELYRLRWQIELAFKRLKSIFRYNEVPARIPENIRAWFYGKLLLAALCETLVNTGRFSPCG